MIKEFFSRIALTHKASWRKFYRLLPLKREDFWNRLSKLGDFIHKSYKMGGRNVPESSRVLSDLSPGTVWACWEAVGPSLSRMVRPVLDMAGLWRLEESETPTGRERFRWEFENKVEQFVMFLPLTFSNTVYWRCLKVTSNIFTVTFSNTVYLDVLK